MLRIAILPNSYKDHLSGEEVCGAIKAGLQKSLGSSVKIFSQPIPDGGFGTAKVIACHFNAKRCKIKTRDLLMRPIQAEYFFDTKRKIGFLDMASVAGSHLLKKAERNPQKTTTYGVGKTISILIHKGAKKIFVGLGDSGTNDGGIGMAQGLGYKFLDSKNKLLPNGRFCFKRIKKIVPSALNSDLEVIGLCDGSFKLVGKDSISLNVSQQKGATQQMAESLEREMTHVNNLYKRYFGFDFEKIGQSGCAGGLGAGIMAFLNAKLVWGADYIMKKVKIDKIIPKQDLVIAAEGQLDFKTVRGKSSYMIAKEAQKHNVSFVMFVGQLSTGYDKIFKHGATSTLTTDPLIYSLEEVKKKNLGKKYIRDKAEEFGNLLKISAVK